MYFTPIEFRLRRKYRLQGQEGRNMKASTCVSYSNAVRAKERQDQKIDDGNFQGALGHERSSWPEGGRGGLPQPTRFEGNSRVWDFDPRR